MYRNLITGLYLLFASTLLFGCDESAKIRPLPSDAVVLAFGDSLTHGTGAPEGQAYPVVLAEMLDKTVINAGVPGEISAAGRKRLPKELARHNPALVILCHGGNDFLRRLDQQETIKNLKEMIEMTRAQGIDIILVGVPKLGLGLQIPDFYLELANQYQLPYEEEILIDLLGDNRLKSDTIHPNAKGYHLLAEAIHEVINKAQNN